MWGHGQQGPEPVRWERSEGAEWHVIQMVHWLVEIVKEHSMVAFVAIDETACAAFQVETVAEAVECEETVAVWKVEIAVAVVRRLRLGAVVTVVMVDAVATREGASDEQEDELAATQATVLST